MLCKQYAVDLHLTILVATNQFGRAHLYSGRTIFSFADGEGVSIDSIHDFKVTKSGSMRIAKSAATRFQCLRL